MAVADHTVVGPWHKFDNCPESATISAEHAAKGGQSYGDQGALMPILSALIAGYTSD